MINRIITLLVLLSLPLAVLASDNFDLWYDDDEFSLNAFTNTSTFKEITDNMPASLDDEEFDLFSLETEAFSNDAPGAQIDNSNQNYSAPINIQQIQSYSLPTNYNFYNQFYFLPMAVYNPESYFIQNNSNNIFIQPYAPQTNFYHHDLSNDQSGQMPTSNTQVYESIVTKNISQPSTAEPPAVEYTFVNSWDSEPNFPDSILKRGVDNADNQNFKKRKLDNDDDELAEHLRKIITERQNLNTAVINIGEVATRFPYDEFCENFPYELTLCQKKALQEIDDDFRSGKPMNRVLVGSVGFGKTEVALRSAFKVVAADQQVVVIAPTKLLVDQHFNTFTKRFKGTQFSVVRVPSQYKNNKFLNQVRNGTADIIIGAHGAFSDQITYRNIGLIIIDEEQKFSVKQKEILHKSFNNAHVLWMSATPIPRTMKLMQRQLMTSSRLTTPPTGRLSVISDIIEFSEADLRPIIDRELARGGQVFVVIPNIKNIKNQMDILVKMYPNVSIDIAHGEMKNEDINNALKKFRTHNTDILVATTIVEVGMDIPNANTMIIYHPVRLGIASLSQLRGRVGRSDKQAYCYIATIPGASIPEKTMARVRAFIKHGELGGDYQLSEEDSLVRGAGSLFKNRQKGRGKWDRINYAIDPADNN